MRLAFPLLALFASITSCDNPALEQENASLRQQATELEEQNKKMKKELGEMKPRLTAAENAAKAAEIAAKAVKSSASSPYQQTLLPHLLLADGSPAKEGDLNPGGLTLYYYSASWCGACKQVTGFFGQMGHFFKQQGVTLVLVGKDKDRASILAYMKASKFSLGLDAAGIQALKLDPFNDNPPGGTPFIALMDRDGKIVFKGNPGHYLKGLFNMGYRPQ